jgi:small-conductance mechanosensitive channel
MPMPHGPTIASFVSDNEDVIVAIAIVVATFVLAEIVNRMLANRAHKVGERLVRGVLSPAADTRLRLVRRLVFVSILVVGIALALWQIDSVKKVAAGVLASSALLGLVVGFAARQTLANAIAGISLVISQPIRVGDLVTFEEETGEVEDVRLAYTSIRCADGRRLVVPNERLAQSTIVNHTVVDPRVQVHVDLWLARDADADAAIGVLQDADTEVHVEEISTDGIRLLVTAWADTPAQRTTVAARLRQDSLRKLRNQALS